MVFIKYKAANFIFRTTNATQRPIELSIAKSQCKDISQFKKI